MKKTTVSEASDTICHSMIYRLLVCLEAVKLSLFRFNVSEVIT